MVNVQVTAQIFCFLSLINIAFAFNAVRLLPFYDKYVGKCLQKDAVKKPFTSLLRSSILCYTLFTFTNYYPANAEDMPSSQLVKVKSVAMKDFLSSLDKNEIKKVIFDGIRPSSMKVFYQNGDVGFMYEKDGFPAYDDPKSRSGPAQIIARVQHSPGVICEQDISDVIATLSNKKVKTQPLLKSNPYPKTYAFYPEEYLGGEDNTFLNRYNGKDSFH